MMMLVEVVFPVVESLLYLSPGVFSDLHQLDFLSLRKNKLATLRPGVFDSQSHLTVLELSANKITSVRVRGG